MLSQSTATRVFPSITGRPDGPINFASGPLAIGTGLYSTTMLTGVLALNNNGKVGYVVSFDVTALLPDDYVSDVGVRLSLYKRLASALDEAHVGEIAVEMEDRFGAPPPEATACADR